jgi:hypothetical protein
LSVHQAGDLHQLNLALADQTSNSTHICSEAPEVPQLRDWFRRRAKPPEWQFYYFNARLPQPVSSISGLGWQQNGCLYAPPL